MKGVRIIFAIMYALCGNIKTYDALIMPNYSLNMSNCLNYANYADKPNLHIVSVFLQTKRRSLWQYIKDLWCNGFG